MNEIINLSNFLKEAFSNDEYAYRNTSEELSNIEKRIAELEDKLKDVDNYKKDIKGAVFVQEILTKHASNNREENLTEYKGLIELANSEIESLQNEINLVNINLREKIDRLSIVQNDEERISLQKEIRDLSNEKNDLRSEITNLISDKEYFNSEIDKINIEINEDKIRLEELENVKINKEALEKDKKELDDLKLEATHLEKYAADLVTLNNFFDVVSKIENNQEYNEENLNSILNDISDISVNLKSLSEVESLIESKNQERNEINEKLKDETNYLENYLDINVAKSNRYDKLYKNNKENYETTEKLLENLEIQMEPLKNNRLEQENTLSQISALSVMFREDDKQDDYYQAEFKRLYDKLEGLKKEEKNLVVSLDEDSYLTNKEQLLKRREIISRDLVHIEKLMTESNNAKFNRFKMNEDRIKLSLLDREINSLTNIKNLFSKVKSASEIYGLNVKNNDNILDEVTNKDNVDSKTEENIVEEKTNEDNLNPLSYDLDSLDGLGAFYDAVMSEGKNNNSNVNNLSDGNDLDNFDLPGADEPKKETKENIQSDKTDENDKQDDLDLEPTGDITPVEDVKKCTKWDKIKNKIKGNLKKILATVLVGSATLAAIINIGGKNVDSPKEDSIVETTFVSQNIEEDTKVKTEEISASLNEFDITAPSTSDIYTYEESPVNEISTVNEFEKVDRAFNIGDTYIASGDIYGTSYDAKNDINGLDHYYPLSDDRTVSAIQFVSPDGQQHVTVTENNKEDADILRSLGWMEESYCTSNETRDLEYEGWHRR